MHHDSSEPTDEPREVTTEPSHVELLHLAVARRALAVRGQLNLGRAGELVDAGLLAWVPGQKVAATMTGVATWAAHTEVNPDWAPSVMRWPAGTPVVIDTGRPTRRPAAAKVHFAQLPFTTGALAGEVLAVCGADGTADSWYPAGAWEHLGSVRCLLCLRKVAP